MKRRFIMLVLLPWLVGCSDKDAATVAQLQVLAQLQKMEKKADIDVQGLQGDIARSSEQSAQRHKDLEKKIEGKFTDAKAETSKQIEAVEKRIKDDQDKLKAKLENLENARSATVQPDPETKVSPLKEIHSHWKDVKKALTEFSQLAEIVNDAEKVRRALEAPSRTSSVPARSVLQEYGNFNAPDFILEWIREHVRDVKHWNWWPVHTGWGIRYWARYVDHCGRPHTKSWYE